MQLGYVTLGAKKKEATLAFYDALFAEFGAKRMFDNGHMFFYGAGGMPLIGVGDPFNEEPATAGNGTMVALIADSREQVDTLHAKAMELGATDEGAPGERSPQFYGGYFRDPSGNKLVFCHLNMG